MMCWERGWWSCCDVDGSTDGCIDGVAQEGSRLRGSPEADERRRHVSLVLNCKTDSFNVELIREIIVNF